MITADEILEKLGERFGLAADRRGDPGQCAGRDPSRVQGGPQTVGIIAQRHAPVLR